MTSVDVYTVFKPHIMDDQIDIGDAQFVSVDFFTMLFASASSPTPTYQELITIDGGTKGYKNFFDQCKSEGLIV